MGIEELKQVASTVWLILLFAFTGIVIMQSIIYKLKERKHEKTNTLDRNNTSM